MKTLAHKPKSCLSMNTCARRKPVPVRGPTTACNFATGSQQLRGHGEGGWPQAGYDLKKGTVTPELRNLILTYGEMAQATYDQLGLDSCTRDTYGTIEVAPAKMLEYLDVNYPLAPGAPSGDRVATGTMYRLPDNPDMNPLLFALPGKLVPGKDVAKKGPPKRSKSWAIGIVDSLFTTTTQVLANVVDGGNGGRALFRELESDGRGKVERGAFIGYVAVSEAVGEDKEVDVALVWRGTIFKEEWESNFVMNELDGWKPEATFRAQQLCEQSSSCPPGPVNPALWQPETPDPRQVGVHDGFQDLYDRPVRQAWPASSDTVRRSPRESVHAWLSELMNVYNVTTITTTGHSLGGGLATLCAYDVGCWVEKKWEDNKDPFKTTRNPPKVTCISFAAPRVGNATFVEHFNKLGVKALRVVNKGDIVPLVPGFLVQFWTSVLEGISGKAPWLVAPAALLDMQSGPISLVRNLSKWYSIACAALNKDWRSRWGFWHVGQVLELDVGDAPKGVLREDVGTGQRHNLELYMYLASLAPSDTSSSTSSSGNKGTSGKKTTSRNTLLMNKSDDLLANTKIPANWWRPDDHRKVGKVNGRWVPPSATNKPPASDTALP